MSIDDTTPLPEDDVDARRAERLASGEEFSAEDDFERTLVAYRRQTRSAPSPVGLSEHLWARIAEESFGSSRLRLVPKWVRWSTAAAVALIAAVSWLELSQGPTLVSSASQSIVRLDLEDGSVVTLRPHTLLYESEDGYLVEGEAFFNVSQDPSRVFRVRSKQGEVRVLGTRFNVSAWGAHTSVFLEAGRVVFEHVEGTIDTLSPGEVLLASAGEHRVRRAENDGAMYVSWLNQTLVFGGRPLSLILEELEHHFGVRVVVPDSLKSEELSGQLVLSIPEESLADLGKLFGARFEEGDENVFYFTGE